MVKFAIGLAAVGLGMWLIGFVTLMVSAAFDTNIPHKFLFLSLTSALLCFVAAGVVGVIGMERKYR